MKALVILMLISIGISTFNTDKKWMLAKNKNGIKVYVSETSGSNYYMFKAIMSVRAPGTEVITILKDVSNYPEWFAFTASSKLIKQSENEQFFFMETDYPWPYSNECMNYNMKIVELPGEQQKIIITGRNNNTNCKYSLKKASGYILLEPDNGNTKITFYFHTEPAQNIPSWLINPMIHEMPYQTFISLRKKLNSANY